MSKSAPKKSSSPSNKNAAPIAASAEEKALPVEETALQDHTATAKLCVALLDDSCDFTHRQEEILAVAHFMQKQGFEVQLFCPKASELMQKAVAQGIAVKPLAGLWITRLRLFWHYKRQKPLLLHSFSAATAHLAQAFSASRLEGCTLCVHSFFDLPQGIDRALDKAQERNIPLAHIELYKKTQSCVFSSDFMKKQWEKQSLTHGNSTTIFSALPVEPWEEAPKAQHELRDGRCIFAVAANIAQGAGLGTVLKAMALLLEQEKAQELPNSFEVRLLGNGAEFDSLLTEARGLGVEGRLALLGEQDLAQMLPLMHGLILPQEDTVQASDALLALMGAWHVGLPVICAETLPYTELSSGKMLFFAADNAEELAWHMRSLMQNATLRQNQGIFSAAMQDYSLMPRLQQEYGQVYARVLEQRGWGFMYK